MKKHSYSYRFCKTTWGVAIDITAELTSFAAWQDWSLLQVCEKAEDGLWFSVVGFQPSREDRKYLRLGLRLLHASLAEAVGGGGELLVVFHDIDYNPSDFQVEGLAKAVVDWGVDAFGLPPIPIQVEYDRASNEYLYDFPQP